MIYFGYHIDFLKARSLFPAGILLAISVLLDPGGHLWLFYFSETSSLSPMVFLTLWSPDISLALSFSQPFLPSLPLSPLLPRLFISLGLFLCPLLSTFYLLSPRERPQHGHQKQAGSVLASDLKAIIISWPPTHQILDSGLFSSLSFWIQSIAKYLYFFLQNISHSTSFFPIFSCVSLDQYQPRFDPSLMANSNHPEHCNLF